MKCTTRKGALTGLTSGSILAIGLLLRALSLSPPGGEGERLMWYLTYTAIFGAPVSLVIAPICVALISYPGLHLLSYVLLTLSVPANWGLGGAAIGYIVGRMKKGPRSPHRSDESSAI